jgi:hypothetical protein
MRLLVHRQLHQLAALQINSVTGSLATNLRSAALQLKSLKLKGVRRPVRGQNRGVPEAGMAPLGYLWGAGRDCPHLVCARNQTPSQKFLCNFFWAPCRCGQDLCARPNLGCGPPWTCATGWEMSALPLKADIAQRGRQCPLSAKSGHPAGPPKPRRS